MTMGESHQRAWPTTWMQTDLGLDSGRLPRSDLRARILRVGIATHGWPLGSSPRRRLVEVMAKKHHSMKHRSIAIEIVAVVAIVYSVVMYLLVHWLFT